ncbi:hypothetical protein EMIT07CA2_10399 [Brevibacillus sp. IT-7CA2]
MKLVSLNEVKIYMYTPNINENDGFFLKTSMFFLFTIAMRVNVHFFDVLALRRQNLTVFLYIQDS